MRDPRPVHIKILLGRFISVLPPAGHSAECSKHYKPDQRTTGGKSKQKSFRTEDTRDTRANPLLLAPRKMIDLAVHDAKLCNDAEPTEDALIARNWIYQQIGSPDKTLYSSNPAYRQAYKDAFYLSLEWCCTWLEIKDCEQYRQDLIHQIDDAIAKQWLKLRKPSFEARMRDLVGRELAKDFNPEIERNQIGMFQ
jgi:hypothetical protein